MDDDYTKADFLADTAVRYWDGAYAEELMARFFDLQVVA